ncbi:integrase core domain-containing protein, partial [Aeromonas caviae]|uniref:integrase core domain-containing protein n=7 Tax=Aeromonadaceae TaxID=84642 RepID=UPI0038CFC4F6
YIERFNRTVRYDWLGHYLFESLNELQEFATNWLWVYNHERPNAYSHAWRSLNNIHADHVITSMPITQ